MLPGGEIRCLTDWPMLLLYFVFCIAMLYVLVFASDKADLNRLGCPLCGNRLVWARHRRSRVSEMPLSRTGSTMVLTIVERSVTPAP